MLNKNILGATLIIALVLLATLLRGNDTMLIEKTVRIIFGSVFILFLPGYFLTVTFFDDKEIDRLERFALSFALSISVVPLLTFYTNLLGWKITQVNVYLVVCIVIALNIVYYYLPSRFTFRKKDNEVASK